MVEAPSLQNRGKRKKPELKGRGESTYAVNEQIRRHVKGGGSSLVSLQQRHPKDGLRMATKELMLSSELLNIMEPTPHPSL